MQCSTVPGTRPLAILYKNGHPNNRMNYKAVSRAVSRYINHLNISTMQDKRDRIVILLSNNVSSKKLTEKLQLPGVKLYDGGVEMFDNGNAPKYYKLSEDQSAQQDLDIGDWVSKGGILVTHAQQFKGCEASNVLLLTNYSNFSSRTMFFVFLLACLLGWLVGDQVRKVGGLVAAVVAGFITSAVIILLQLVFISKEYAGVTLNYRSSIMRGVAGLAIVLNHRRFPVETLRTHFDVITDG